MTRGRTTATHIRQIGLDRRTVPCDDPEPALLVGLSDRGRAATNETAEQ